LWNDFEYRTSPCGDDKQKHLLLIPHQEVIGLVVMGVVDSAGRFCLVVVVVT